MGATSCVLGEIIDPGFRREVFVQHLSPAAQDIRLFVIRNGRIPDDGDFDWIAGGGMNGCKQYAGEKEYAE